jgi:hypothetical protein
MRSERERERRGKTAMVHATKLKGKGKRKKKGGELCNDSDRELGGSKAVFDPRAVKKLERFLHLC